jgi:hypothetical protein
MNIENYIHSTADCMGLGHWELVISWVSDDKMEVSPLDGETILAASCEPRVGMYIADIQLNENELEECSEHEISEIVVHELVHCYMAEQHHLCLHGLKIHMSEITFKAFMLSFSMAWERAIDAISRSWAGSLPPYARSSK